MVKLSRKIATSRFLVTLVILLGSVIVLNSIDPIKKVWERVTRRAPKEVTKVVKQSIEKPIAIDLFGIEITIKNSIAKKIIEGLILSMIIATIASIILIIKN